MYIYICVCVCVHILRYCKRYVHFYHPRGGRVWKIAKKCIARRVLRLYYARIICIVHTGSVIPRLGSHPAKTLWRHMLVVTGMYKINALSDFDKRQFTNLPYVEFFSRSETFTEISFTPTYVFKNSRLRMRSRFACSNDFDVWTSQSESAIEIYFLCHE